MSNPAQVVSECFVNVTDPRVNRGKNHSFVEIMFMALTATLCGADNWADVERFVQAKVSWFLRYIDLPEGVPSHDTFGRVFAVLDTAQFLRAMQRWVERFAGSLREQGIAIDGKTLRHSFDRATEQSALQTITAYATQTRLCLRQLSIPDKEGEILAAEKLLWLLDLSGAVVTMDALHCQLATVWTIANRKADYLITVKGNQPSLHAAIQEEFAHGQPYTQHVTVEKNRGRLERRDYRVMAAPKNALFRRWTNVRSIGMVHRQRQIGNQDPQEETMFWISSLPPQVKRQSELLRDHWRIENSLHHVLDVTFTEDASRIRKGAAPVLAAALRRMALNILQQDTSVKDNIRGKRVRAGWDSKVLDQIYAKFCHS